MSSFPALWVCVSSDHYTIHSWRVFLSPSGVTLGSQASYSPLRPPWVLSFWHSWESWQTLRTNVSQKQPTVPSFSFPLFANTKCPPCTRHSLPLGPLCLSGLMIFAGWPWASQFILPLLLIPLALLQRSNTKHLGIKLCSILSSYVNALTSVSFKLRMKGSLRCLHCFHTDIIFSFKLTVISPLYKWIQCDMYVIFWVYFIIKCFSEVSCASLPS